MKSLINSRPYRFNNSGFVKMNKLYGAILGDLAGQPYEHKYTGDFSEFNIHNSESHITDDSLMTLATAGYLLAKFNSFEEAYKTIGLKYKESYFGDRFNLWLDSEKGTISDSYGNGCLMRVSPCAYLSEEISLEAAIESTFCSHLHPKSITAVVNLMEQYSIAQLRRNASKSKPSEHIKYAKNNFMVEADKTAELIKHLYWISNSTHKTIESTVKLGGDTDTNASIVGELMNYTFNDLTKEDVEYVESKLDSYLLDILIQFNKKYT